MVTARWSLPGARRRRWFFYVPNYRDGANINVIVRVTVPNVESQDFTPNPARVLKPQLSYIHLNCTSIYKEVTNGDYDLQFARQITYSREIINHVSMTLWNVFRGIVGTFSIT